VRALVRMGSEYFWLNDTGAGYFFADLRDEDSLRRGLTGCTHLVHAACVGMESSDNHHANTTREGGLALVRAAAATGLQHVVMASCTAVVSHPQVPKLHALAQVEHALVESGLSHSILRFTPFAEEFADLALQAASGERAVLWGSGDANIRAIGRRDAALMCMAALDHSAARNRVLAVSGPEEMAVDELLERACALAQASPGSIQRRSGVARTLARRGLSLALGRRWENHIDWCAALHDADHAPPPLAAEALDLPLTAVAKVIRKAIEERHPRENPLARDERVVHRQFQATVYTPGERKIDDLPQGPVD
jgi:uncharacterized protein YbjT (DUF2867 family)